MSMQDPISDMLTRIRNAHARGHQTVTMPSSQLKEHVAALLEQEGYLVGHRVSEGAKRELTIELKYFDGKPVIEMLKRVSRPGLRIYKACTDLPQVLRGLGIAVISTSQGLMTDREARKRGIGGEVICYVA